MSDALLVPGAEEAPVAAGPQRARIEVRSARLVLSVVRVAVWVFVNVTMLLGAWVLLGWSLGGWTPVVITSGSMEPTLGVGDILMVDGETPEELAQRTIVLFERDGDRVAHRVFAIEDDLLVTKGDANPSPDVRRVDPADVEGVGRLIVPFVGLPVIWASTGDWVPLGSWLALMAAGAIGVAVGLERAITRRRRGDAQPPPANIGRVGIQRVRSLVAILVVVQYLIDPDRFTIDAGRISPEIVVSAALAVLLGTNFVAGRAFKRADGGRLGALLELGLDTLLVVVLTMTTDSSGSSWVLYSLPIVEAAVRFRVVGALVHWMTLTLIALAAKVWSSANAAPATMFDELEALLDQLSVLFLVVVPASYLAEQLLGEVRSWQRATGSAVDRSQLLVQVADLGREIVRLDVGHLDVIAAGTRSLGFGAVDIVLEDDVDLWRVVGGGGLLRPGEAGSGVCPGDLVSGGAYVTIDDPDDEDARALAAAGFTALLAQVVSEREGRRLVLRAALSDAAGLTPELVEAFRLVAGQATVAFRNEELMAEITSIHDELEHQATHDALTGLANRVRLLERLEAADDPMLLFLDLNGFKPVNDRMGHEAGDEVLKMVAERLVRTAPPGSLVCRLGGDEFTVLLAPGLDPGDAMFVAEAIIAEIQIPFDLGGATANIGTSIGVAIGDATVSAAELIRRADVAMYEAKHRPREGEPQVEVYRQEFDAVEERRAMLAAELHRSLLRGEIRLAFQPVVDLVSGLAVGAEALVRWDHPHLGAVPPPDIIEAARNAGIRDELHSHIISTAATRAREWVEIAGDRPFFVAVNASPEELGSPQLVEHIANGLEHSGLAPDRLYIEISERLVSPPSDPVLVNIHAMRSMGVGLLLDDFGQGNTSLSYLHELPVAGIKLDRSLVVNAVRSAADRAIVESVVALSERLGHVVVAEGIEHEEQAEALRSLGCPLAQGYFFGRPVTAEEVTIRLREETVAYEALRGSRARA